ncbi:MAG: hypothetical protein ACT4RN_16025 [Pseudonocardia sp.]
MSSPTDPRAGQAPPTRAGGAVPRAILVSISAWLVLAAVLVLAWLGLDAGPGSAGDESVAPIRDALGPSAVAGGNGGGALAMLLPLLAVVVVLALFGLFLRKGWVLWPLTLTGLVGVLVLASGGRWETLLAMPLVLVGAVALMTRGAREYLR